MVAPSSFHNEKRPGLPLIGGGRALPWPRPDNRDGGRAAARLKGRAMCKVLTSQSPLHFRKASRSMRIAGHSTTVRLEEAFWQVLDEMALREGLSTSRLISVLYEEALERHGAAPNFASLLRTVCLLYRGMIPPEG